jgi:hypothetical protein
MKSQKGEMPKGKGNFPRSRHFAISQAFEFEEKKHVAPKTFMLPRGIAPRGLGFSARRNR